MVGIFGKNRQQDLLITSGIRHLRGQTYGRSGILHTTSLFTVMMQWQYIATAELAGSLVLFKNQSGNVYIVPIRAFDRAEDRRIVQQLAEALVPNCRW